MFLDRSLRCRVPDRRASLWDYLLTLLAPILIEPLFTLFEDADDLLFAEA